jgi:hypothetical protein
MKPIFFLLACLLAGHANAGWTDKQGTLLPDSEERKSIGGFDAQIIFTHDEQALYEKWAAPSEIVNLDAVESVSSSHPLNAFVIFRGCKPSARAHEAPWQTGRP